MNLRVLAIIIILSLCFFFGFKKISPIRNVNINATIEELKILDYVPKDNKLLFISNCKSSKLIDNLRKELSKENLNKIFLIRNSILAYLGIDIGDNKIEDIYNSELAISTYENDKNTKDDILIIFKIKPDKKLNDLLNIQNNFDQSNEIIPIYRENKLNYLNYIYKTKDDYIISSSNKNLILDSLRSNNLKDKNQELSPQIMKNLTNEDTILLSKNFENNFFSNKKIFPTINNEDIIATTFTIRDKDLVLKSYLINNKKNIDFSSYTDLQDKNIIDQVDYQVSFYRNSKNSSEDLKTIINNFETSFLEEINREIDKNILILSSEKDWIIIFENNNQNREIISKSEQLRSFKRNDFEINDDIYSVFTKNIFEKDDNTIKKITHEDIFSVETDELFFMSNKFIEDYKKDLITTKFLKLKNNVDEHDFLFKKIAIKDLPFKSYDYLSFSDNLLFILGGMGNHPKEKFTQIVKQSIPEKDPIIYSETALKIFQ